MSQIAGRRLPQAGIANQDFSFASVTPTDSMGNSALATVSFGPSNTQYNDDTDVALGVFYYLDKACDADPTKAVWRVMRATVVSPGVSKYEWAHTLGAAPEHAGYNHLQADIRDLTKLGYK